MEALLSKCLPCLFRKQPQRNKTDELQRPKLKQSQTLSYRRESDETGDTPEVELSLKNIHLDAENESNGSDNETMDRKVMYSPGKLGANQVVEGVDDDLSPVRADPSLEVTAKLKELIRRRTNADSEPGKRNYRISLFGCANAGKSTILRQFQLIQGQVPSDEDRLLHRETILLNLFDNVRGVLNLMSSLTIAFTHPENEIALDTFEQVLDLTAIEECLNSSRDQIIKTLKSLQEDAGFQLAMRRGFDFNLLESTPYFLAHSGRILAADYIPTDDDILRSRAATMSHIQERVNFDSSAQILYRFSDVGGFRFQRTRWNDSGAMNTDVIVYVHALSCYDQRVEEDGDVAQFDESLAVFEGLVNDKTLKELPFVLLFSKRDILQEKLKTRQLRPFFPDFSGKGNDYQDAVVYFRQRFLSVVHEQKRPFFVYMTNAFERESIKALFKKLARVAFESGGKAS